MVQYNVAISAVWHELWSHGGNNLRRKYGIDLVLRIYTTIELRVRFVHQRSNDQHNCVGDRLDLAVPLRSRGIDANDARRQVICRQSFGAIRLRHWHRKLQNCRGTNGLPLLHLRLGSGRDR